jgi:hypothetical protein
MSWEFFLRGWGVGFTIYAALQLVAVVTAPRGRRAVMMIPVPLMVAILLWTIYAYQVGANLWPLMIIFASPIACVGVVVTWVAVFLHERRDAP